MQQLDGIQRLDDGVLIERLTHSVTCDRQLAVRLLVEMGEVHARGLFRDLGFSTMFDFATKKLGMSEGEAALRIRVAKLGRAFPIALELLERRELNLTTLSLLAPVLTADNLPLLHEARFRSKQQVLTLLARHEPKPDVPDSVRKLPPPRARATSAPGHAVVPLSVPPSVPGGQNAPSAQAALPLSAAPSDQSAPTTQVALSLSAPLSVPTNQGAPTPVAVLPPPSVPPNVPTNRGARHRITFTASQPVRDLLEQAQDLLRHRHPDGDLERLFERALELLVAQEKQRQFGHADKPRGQGHRSDEHSRYVPREVRRQVYARDGGRCRYVGPQGERCRARGMLEFHHVVAFARGGKTCVENLQSICKAHNQLLAERGYGRALMQARAARSGCAQDTRANSISSQHSTAPAEAAGCLDRPPLPAAGADMETGRPRELETSRM